jgi:large subunit ribosomal protein L3
MKKKIGILGQKLEMTQIPSSNGYYSPVTAVLVEDNWISQIKTKEKDGYVACQIASCERKSKNLNRSVLNHLKKANIAPKRYLRELRDMEGTEVGSVIDLSIFKEGDKVSVTGKSKGKGFAGVIKRHNQSRGPMAHGSGYHRGVGSLSSGRDNNRVLKGKKMPGRMGSDKVTFHKIVVERIDKENKIMFLRGGMPGSRDSLLIISKGT